MHNIKTLEKYFRKYLKNLNLMHPENFVNVDLKLLHDFDLLKFHQRKMADLGFTRYFQVMETPDKITLINDEFIIWIVPENIEGKSTTYTLVALNSDKEPKLESVLFFSGVYNSTHLILNVLERFLLDVQQSEELLQKLS